MNLVIRADADRTIGAGHVLRTLALAQEWRARSGTFSYVGRIGSDSLRRRIVEEGGRLLQPDDDPDPKLLHEALVAEGSRSRWAALDGYHFDPVEAEALKRVGCRVLAVDDGVTLAALPADLLLNQNTSETSAKATAVLLHGPRYALLRKTLRASCSRSPDRRDGGVLVLFGGSDPAELTARTLHMFAHLPQPPRAGVAVLGPLVPSADEARRAAEQLGPGWSVRTDLNDAALADALSRTELAISACGSSIWELCAFSVPTLAFAVAANQGPLLASLAAIGAVADAPTPASFDERDFAALFERFRADRGALERMRELGRAMVDGKGASRVVDAMMALDGTDVLQLAPARTEDAFLLWRWANDPETRAQSFGTASIGWEEHRHWLADRLRDRSSEIFILSWKTIPVGVVRYNRVEPSRALVGFSVDRNFRHRGFGRDLIRSSLREARRLLQVDTFEAETRPENERSRKIFRSMGFEETELPGVSPPRIRFVLRTPEPGKAG